MISPIGTDSSSLETYFLGNILCYSTVSTWLRDNDVAWQLLSKLCKRYVVIESYLLNIINHSLSISSLHLFHLSLISISPNCPSSPSLPSVPHLHLSHLSLISISPNCPSSPSLSSVPHLHFSYIPHLHLSNLPLLPFIGPPSAIKQCTHSLCSNTSDPTNTFCYM